MYDFDMNALLTAFNGDPEKLAQAFTDQLNKELDNRNKEKEVKNVAGEVAAAWNLFVNKYCELYGIKEPKTYHLTSGEDVIGLLNVVISFLPEVEKYLNVVEKISPALEKSEATIDEFQKTMKDFFKKYHI